MEANQLLLGMTVIMSGLAENTRLETQEEQGETDTSHGVGTLLERTSAIEDKNVEGFDKSILHFKGGCWKS